MRHLKTHFLRRPNMSAAKRLCIQRHYMRCINAVLSCLIFIHTRHFYQSSQSFGRYLYTVASLQVAFNSGRFIQKERKGESLSRLLLFAKIILIK